MRIELFGPSRHNTAACPSQSLSPIGPTLDERAAASDVLPEVVTIMKDFAIAAPASVVSTMRPTASADQAYSHPPPTNRTEPSIPRRHECSSTKRF